MDARALPLLPASMKRYAAALLVILSAVALMAPGIPAQTRPKLADYFTPIPQTVLDARYSPLRLSQDTWNEDLDGDGNQDVVVLGFNYPFSGVYDVTEPNFDVPQPGRVFLGDGNGRFTAAPTNLFPIDTLQMVFPKKVLFADFNADGRPDMFISTIGWDILPSPGEQNRLFLSRPEGGWQDATGTLPQLRDYSNSAAAGDISGRGVIDIFVGNVKPALNLIRAYTLLNNGSGLFTQMSANLPVGNNQLLEDDQPPISRRDARRSERRWTAGAHRNGGQQGQDSPFDHPVEPPRRLRGNRRYGAARASNLHEQPLRHRRAAHRREPGRLAGLGARWRAKHEPFERVVRANSRQPRQPPVR